MDTYDEYRALVDAHERQKCDDLRAENTRLHIQLHIQRMAEAAVQRFEAQAQAATVGEFGRTRSTHYRDGRKQLSGKVRGRRAHLLAKLGATP